MTDKERFDTLALSLTNITPDADAIARIERLRAQAKDFGLAIIHEARDGRERSLSLTHLEETVMWAVKSIVLGQEA